jgi:hypothetical protein
MAMSNIRQRFALAYGHNSKVDVDQSNTHYTVRLKFPYEETPA